jgi:hypothetical protein
MISIVLRGIATATHASLSLEKCPFVKGINSPSMEPESPPILVTNQEQGDPVAKARNGKLLSH